MSTLQSTLEKMEKDFDEKFASAKDTDLHYYNSYIFDMKKFLSFAITSAVTEAFRATVACGISKYMLGNDGEKVAFNSALSEVALKQQEWMGK